MPVSANAFSSASAASGSSSTTSRSATSTSVTRTPKSAITCASSHPIAPPPITTRDDGSSVSFTASRLVQYGVSARPGMGGAEGAVPVLSTIPFVAVYVVPPTSTRPSPPSTPWPRTKVAPASSRRFTATVSSQSSVASSRMRVATGVQSGVTVAEPASSLTRPASRRVWAAAIIIFDGTQPK